MLVPPLEFTSEDLKGIMTEDELREEAGLPPLDVEVREDFAKVGSMITDGVELPLYDTKEEAEAEAKKIGCSGSHTHTQDGKTYYMPCENHEQITNLNKCNCKTELSELTELDKFIEEYGEDMPEEWQLVEEEKVVDEHEDFDFEKTLNNAVNEKLELKTSTGKAIPSRKSEQDGVSKKSGDYFRVRYVYAEDNFLVNKTGQKREFCKKMMAAKKLYRKEDILRMSEKTVNDYYYSERQKRNIGWGANGELQYSIWLYKGGGNCQHFWLRKIYKTSLRNAKQPISDSQLIGYTKARSEGFTAEKNDNLVAKPPKRMRNNGFIKRR